MSSEEKKIGKLKQKKSKLRDFTLNQGRACFKYNRKQSKKL